MTGEAYHSDCGAKGALRGQHWPTNTDYSQLRLWQLLRRHRFALQLDVKTYFPSIDLEILRRLLRERIADPRYLAVIDRILESFRDELAERLRRLAAG